MPSFAKFASTCTPPNLEAIDKKELRCWIGPPTDLDELNLNMDEKPTLGDHISEEVANKFEMVFPGGETEGLARLSRMVSWLCLSCKFMGK